jgi:hypothetical protein
MICSSLQRACYVGRELFTHLADFASGMIVSTFLVDLEACRLPPTPRMGSWGGTGFLSAVD